MAATLPINTAVTTDAAGHDSPRGPQGSVPPNSPRSPSRGRLSRALSFLGAKIGTTLGSTPGHGGGGGVPETASPGSQTAHRGGIGHGQGRVFADDESTLSDDKERSISRGREAFMSTGRGGAGNIRQSSLSRDARPDSGPDDFSDSRGREPRVDHAHIFSTGRGGVGNMRSPSRDVGVLRSGADHKDQEVIKSHLAVDNEIGVHSTGRGGAGNIRGGSRSRSRARDSLVGSGTHTPIHSTGRGGAGNIFPGAGPHEDERESLAAKGHHHADNIHSTGRGGAANITHLHSPPVEHSHHEHHHGAYESTGRGGAGNIIHEE